MEIMKMRVVVASASTVVVILSAAVMGGCGSTESNATFKQASALRTATVAYLDNYPPGSSAEAQSLLNLAERTRRSLPIEGKQANLTWSATGEITRGLKLDNPPRQKEFLSRAVDLLDEAIEQ